MKIKTLIIIGLFVALSGCIGIISDNDVSPQAQSIPEDGNSAVAKLEYQDKDSKKALADERHIKRMMAWINISTD